jgi:hypothetical protein
MMETYLLSPETDLSTKPQKKKSVGLKTITLLVLGALGVGFGIGYFIHDNQVKGQRIASGNGTAMLKKSGHGSCHASASIDSISLAAPSKNIAEAMTVPEVRDHFDWDMNTPIFEYASNTKTTFSCVDARSSHPILGTPGGDFAEFAIGLDVYFRSIGTNPTLEAVRDLFKKFMKAHISKSRPFYFHTDDSRLRRVYNKMETSLGRKITVLPYKTPESKSEAELWLTELTESYAQGCGHIRLMIDYPADYGLSSNFIIKSLIRVYYEEWWSRSVEGKKDFDFNIKLGPLIGGAIAIVNNSGPACGDSSPLISPSAGGSTLFVYHPTAVSAFRESVLVPFFAQKISNQVSSTSFLSQVNSLFTTQLTSTLTKLAPANAVDLFSVQIRSV